MPRVDPPLESEGLHADDLSVMHLPSSVTRWGWLTGWVHRCCEMTSCGLTLRARGNSQLYNCCILDVEARVVECVPDVDYDARQGR